uniref:Uncharacterized protein n=1 Tax=Anguilla anguilla TaxID=7936 RepID=A0A0E9TXE7_ANGAN
MSGATGLHLVQFSFYHHTIRAWKTVSSELASR